MPAPSVLLGLVLGAFAGDAGFCALSIVLSRKVDRDVGWRAANLR